MVRPPGYSFGECLVSFILSIDKRTLYAEKNVESFVLHAHARHDRTRDDDSDSADLVYRPSSPAFLLHGYSVSGQYIVSGALTALFGLMLFFCRSALG